MRCGLVSVEDAQAQQVEAGTTIHLALEHLEPVDVTFDGSVAPRQAKCGHDGSLVSLNRKREAGECGVTRLFQPARPGRDVALADDAEELPGSLRVGGQVPVSGGRDRPTGADAGRARSAAAIATGLRSLVSVAAAVRAGDWTGGHGGDVSRSVPGPNLL